MKKKLGIFAVVLTAVILILFLLPCGMSVIIKDTGGHVYYMRSVLPGDTVSLGFTHSVEKVPVIDTFIVTGNGELLLENTTYGSMGAGLPSDQSYNITTDGKGNFTIENIHITFKKVDFMIIEFTKHYIVVPGETCQLSGIVPPAKPLILSVERNTPAIMVINAIRMVY